jgi:glycosyltransferase involved in cell wall biosynthesis
VHWCEPREEELPGLFGASTVLAIPALSDEVVGRYAARALACGLPILASDLPNLRAFVEPDVNGLLVAPGSVDAWANAIQQTAGAPTTRARWGRESRRFAVERYSWPAIAARFEGLFTDARARVRAKLAERETHGGALAGH